MLGSPVFSYLALPVLLLVAVSVYASLSTNIFISSPAEVGQRFAEWWPVGWRRDLLPSMINVAVGFGFAVVFGILGGLLLGVSRTLREIFTPIIDFIRAIPDAAIVPVLLLIFGLGPGTRMLVVFLSAVWPILIGTMDGAQAIDPRQREMARAFRVPRLRHFFKVILPATSPQILAGVKIGLSVSFIVVIISEMFGSTEGIGHFVIASQRQFDIAGVWVGTLVIATIGYLLNTAFSLLQRRILHWHSSTRSAS
ncbi:ABC transporter permease [Leucobacter sp. wl10]|uniref:ABC transporter permease n=1 Tax=Leucobacter sp. wl10 TaxID=2304677 RepID=UPI0019690D97|nr:ABC transporter permease [Leucobacter sp. wl10]